jgi:hypothetical protein
MEHDEPLVLGSAKRHGVGEADALHAWAFAIPLHAGHLMPIFHDPDHVTIVRSRPTPGRGSRLASKMWTCWARTPTTTR